MASPARIGAPRAAGYHGVQVPIVVSETTLERLFNDVAKAVECGDCPLALRLADRAVRLRPDHPAAIILLGRLLLLAGQPHATLKQLENQQSPDAVIARGQAYAAAGLWPEAVSTCEDLLRNISVDALEPLRSFAASIVRANLVAGHPGWIGIDNDLNLVGMVRPESRLDIRLADGSAVPAVITSKAGEWDLFVCSWPGSITGMATAQIDGVPMLGSPLAWPPHFRLSGWVIREEKRVVGEVFLGWSPKLPVKLAIGRAGETQQRLCMIPTSAGHDAAPFSVPLNRWEQDTARIEVSALLPHGPCIPLAGSPVTMQASALPAPDRCRTGQPVSVPPSASQTERHPVDIVIPVYAGLDETLKCLKSVLDSTERTEAEIVVINDASPDPMLCAALEVMAADGQITLLTNPSNLGFPGAANAGMRLHPERDIVLLNADTEVCGDWLDRLRETASRAGNIGTVTPLSEAGSITDYNRSANGSAVPACVIDSIAREVNAVKAIDLPVGVGICLYIKRECLDATGELDETAFGTGYGEENDFCLRALALGWRHTAAANVFVGHTGGRSYGDAKRILQQRNSRVIEAMYPGYQKLVQEFAVKDPLLEARRAIDMQRLLTEAVRPVLLATLHLPGGVKKHVGCRQVKLTADGHTVIVLQPSDPEKAPGKVVLSVESMGLSSLVFQLPADSDLLRQLLLKLSLTAIEIHHFLGLPPSALELIASLRVAYSVHVHDYSWICPRVTLVGGNGRYCGEPSLTECEACRIHHGSAFEESLTVAALRARSSQILRGAKCIVTPAWDARDRLAGYFPDVSIGVQPWEVLLPPQSRKVRPVTGSIRVAVIGAIGVQKGYQILLNCALDAAARNLNLDFVVIGHTFEDGPLLATGRVFVTGPYQEDEIENLLDREDCDVAFFPSISPETWCYSLTHAITYGLPVLAFDLGAQAERLRSYPAAALLPVASDAQRINAALFALAQRSSISIEPTEVAMEPSATAPMQEDARQFHPEELTSSVQIVTLPTGIYSFTAKGGASSSENSGRLALPALQVGLAPTVSAGSVEFLTGASTVERWLAYSTDMIVIRIVGGDASLLLTSVRVADSPVLAVDVKRLNMEAASGGSEQMDEQPDSGQAPASPRIRLLTHIKNVGDLHFMDSWAGWPGQQLWIEAFSVAPLGRLSADCIEYRGIAANGFHTPWISNQALCGTRGTGMPILGYAVRLKPDIAERYDCQYSGKFFSGVTVGPLQDGMVCGSVVPGDPLEAMEIRITEKRLPPHSSSAPYHPLET